MQDAICELWRCGHVARRGGKCVSLDCVQSSNKVLLPAPVGRDGSTAADCGVQPQLAASGARLASLHCLFARWVSLLSLAPCLACAPRLFGLQLRKIIFDNFGEWGPIENVHLVPSKTLAFVR